MGSRELLHRLRDAGIEAEDSEETRLGKSLLLLATGLVTLASMLWVAIYWSLGQRFSATLPFAYQLLLAGNMLLFLRTGRFGFFRISQLGLFLFAPFLIQWSIGSFLSASGIILWGLLAPVGAILCLGVRQSVPWFLAWIFLTALSGAIDFYLAETKSLPLDIPPGASTVFFVLNFIAIATVIYLLLRHSIEEKRRVQQRLEDAHRRLEQEQERAERLLLNILPAPVAERLKNSDQTIADGFADVTVMFADIVNFTQLAGDLSPAQVFSLLNRIFSAFDDLAGQYGLEKIKTIGDAYMVAGGLNNESRDYTEAIAGMALAMKDLLERDFSINSAHLEIRVGIGTGPVVAGVVGKKKFIYDLWGDTVNIASRITTEGAPGQIQCDTQTFRRLHDRFEFEGPHTLHLKGKGNTPIYRLSGRKTAE